MLIKAGADINTVNNKTYDLLSLILCSYYIECNMETHERKTACEKREGTKIRLFYGNETSLTRMLNRINALEKNGYDLNLPNHADAFSIVTEISTNDLPSEVLFYLFKKGLDPTPTRVDENGDPVCIFQAACDLELPLSVLEELATVIGLDYVYEQYHNCNALLIAISYNKLPLVKKLVEKGSDLHIQNDRALRIAAGLGHIDIVNYLCQQGLDRTRLNQSGNNAIDVAEKGGFKETVDFLRSKV